MENNESMLAFEVVAKRDIQAVFKLLCAMATCCMTGNIPSILTKGPHHTAPTVDAQRMIGFAWSASLLPVQVWNSNSCRPGQFVAVQMWQEG